MAASFDLLATGEGGETGRFIESANPTKLAVRTLMFAEDMPAAPAAAAKVDMDHNLL